MLIFLLSSTRGDDLVISITGVQHRAANKDKPYWTEAKTLGRKSTTYYEINCERAAAQLEVDHHYTAKTRGTKTVLIFLGKDVPTNSGLEGIECEVRNAKVH